MVRRRNRGHQLRSAMTETRSWWIQRSGTTYRFVRDLGGGEYLSYDWWPITGLPSGDLSHQLAQARIGIPMLSVDEDDAATFVGTWSRSQVSATAGYKSKVVTGVALTAGSSANTAVGSGGDLLATTDAARRVTITGAGASGADLSANMSSVTGAPSRSFKISTSASTTVTNATATIWPEARYSVAAGDTASWTSPAGVTALGVRNVLSTNGGLVKVSIDGSTTAANLLPTAQSKVTDGSYAATILVANGGTLNPTDRVMDCYSSSSSNDNVIAIASGLTAGTHAVVLTSTGYTHVGGVGNRAYVTGFSYSTGAETPSTANMDIAAAVTIQPSYSAHEYAYRVFPVAATTLVDFIGRVHGYEVEVSVVMVIDGVTTTITDGTTVPVTSSATITQVTYLKHPENPAGASAHFADITTIYTLDAEGLVVEHTDTWNQHATMTSGYPAMLPVDGGIYDRYTSSGYFGPVTSNLGDGGHKGSGTAWIVAAWSSTGKYATSMEVTAPLGVLGAGRSNPDILPSYIEDRATTGSFRINKIYMPWVGSATVLIDVPAASVWHWKHRYRFKRFSAGAEGTLGAI